MNFKDRDSVIDSYAQYILDSLDMDAVLNIAYDTLVKNLEAYTNEQLATEIVESYGEEWLEDHNVEVNETVQCCASCRGGTLNGHRPQNAL